MTPALITTAALTATILLMVFWQWLTYERERRIARLEHRAAAVRAARAHEHGGIELRHRCALAESQAVRYRTERDALRIMLAEHGHRHAAELAAARRVAAMARRGVLTAIETTATEGTAR